MDNLFINFKNQPQYKKDKLYNLLNDCDKNELEKINLSKIFTILLNGSDFTILSTDVDEKKVFKLLLKKIQENNIDMNNLISKDGLYFFNKYSKHEQIYDFVWDLEKRKEKNKKIFNREIDSDKETSEVLHVCLKESNADFVFDNIFLKDFIKNATPKQEEFIMRFLFLVSVDSLKTNVCKKIIETYALEKYDLTKKYNANEILPNIKKQTDFFISSYDMMKIKKILDLGFKINDAEYQYNGNSLMFCLLKQISKNGFNENYGLLLSFCTNIKKQEEIEFNKMLDNLKTNNIQAYRVCNSIYQKNKLEKTIMAKNESQEIRNKI